MFVGAAFTNSFSYYDNTSQVLLNVIGFIILLFTAIMLTYAIIYYRSILRVLTGIRNGLSGKPIYSLPGIKVFTVLLCISIGSTVLSLFTSLSTLSVMSGDVYSNMFSSLYDLPDELYNIIEPFLANFGRNLILSAISVIVSNAGTLMCIIVLNRFNNRLKYKT